jgi:RNA polymerase sigma-70 factor (ECF subfamily)
MVSTADATRRLDELRPMTREAHPDAAFPGDDDDIALMLRIKAGDMEAFAALVEAHQHRVVGAVAKMLGDTADAEDIAQQVFIRVWKAAARYQPSAKFTTWLYKITRNLVFNELRRRKRRSLVAREDETPRDSADVAAAAPDQALLERELQDAIQAAISSLPETQRMAIILRRYDGLAYEQIAEVLDLTVPAVKSALFRARTELKNRLQKYLE